MRKLFLPIILLLISVLNGLSQVQLSQYFLDETVFNPAFAGSKEAICTNVFLRNQWMGLADLNGNKIGPQSGVFNIHLPVYNLNSGIGMNVVYDKTGFEENLGVKINYAYYVPVKNLNNSLGIGFGVSLLSKSIDFGQLIPEQSGDPLLTSTKKQSGIIPDIDFGIQYQQFKKFYVGISAINLLESYTDIGNVRYNQKRNFYLTSGQYIKLIKNRKRELYLIPSFLVKSNLTNMQFDLNTRLEYNNHLWAGVSWRYQDAIVVLTGINIKGLQIGASYDLTTSYLSAVSNGSIEFFVGYCYSIKPKVKHNCNYNTRYL
jgi:type IX secretion system PorP/SprF family membrane protein